MARRIWISFVVIGLVGLCADVIYSVSVDQKLRPFRSDLPVVSEPFTSTPFTLYSGYHYRLAAGGDGSVPYADCLLGAGGQSRADDCKQHPSSLLVAWSLTDDLDHVLASGVSPGSQPTLEYGQHIEIDLGYLSVSQPTSVRLSLRFRRDPASLAPLHAFLVLDAPDALLAYGVREVVVGAAFLVLACYGGGKLLVTRWRVQRFE